MSRVSECTELLIRVLEMTTTYPSQKQTFTDPSGNSALSTGPSHSQLHTDINDTVESIQDTVGTTAGTNILKDFTAGQFPVRINSSGVVQHTIAGTLTNTVINGTLSGTAIDTDITLAENSDIRVPSQKAVKTYVDTGLAGVGDWKQYSAVTPTSGTLDDPSFPIVFAGVDLTSVLSVGMKVKLTQATDKYFIITAISFSTNTTVTLYGGTDYDLVATGTTAITAFYYSSARVPVGFPMSLAKWTVEVSSSADQSKANPTDNVWYNLSALNITIPIGVWKVEMMGNLYGYASTGKGLIKVAATLSTANNSQSDIDFSIAAGNRSSATSAQQIGTAAYKAKILSLAAKTTYYCNVWSETGSIAAVGFDGNGGTTFIRAICAYL